MLLAVFQVCFMKLNWISFIPCCKDDLFLAALEYLQVSMLQLLFVLVLWYEVL